MKRAFVLTLVFAALLSQIATAATPGFGQLFYDGDTVRTVVPPAATPQEGRDNLYVIMDGAMGQLAVAAVAPGDRDYHGGQWAFHRVTWNVTPYLLRSEDEVLAATGVGDITVERLADNDFNCPIQP